MEVSKGTLGLGLMVLSLVPLAFLLWTLAHLGSLGIDWYHPLVMVETAVFLALLLAGRYHAFGS
jgi:hypothetical protein